MPRRTLSVSDGGCTLSLAMPPPPVYPARFRGGPLNGVVLPVRTVAGGWPKFATWAAMGQILVYRLDGDGYALDAITHSLHERYDPYRYCPHCLAVTASPDLRSWLCVNAKCCGAVHSAA